MMEKEIGICAQAKRAHRIGQKTYLVEIKNQKDKEIIMKNKHKLRNNRVDRIYINGDMANKELKMRRLFWKRAREKRDRGKTVKVGYNKITIDDEE